MSETRLESAVVAPPSTADDQLKPVMASNGSAPETGAIEARVSEVSLKPTDAPVAAAAAAADAAAAAAGGEAAVHTVPRTIGLVGAISFIVGTMIGSGIFVSPKGVAIGSGSVALCLLSWVICGVISTLAALCYAEMGCVVKASGADYALLEAAFGSILSFVFTWCWAILLKPASIATLSLTSAQYILAVFFDDGCGYPPELIAKCLAVLILLTLWGINMYSVKLAARVQIIFTAAKLLALAIIIVGGIYRLSTGHTGILATGFSGSNSKLGVVAVGFYGGMFAFDGWNSANFILEEIINPQRNLPLAIILGVPIVTLVYLMANVSYFTVMTIDEMSKSNAVAVTWAEEIFPAIVWIIPIFVAMSSFGSANGSVFATGRLLFVTARNEHMPEFLAMVHVRNFGPQPATVILMLGTLVLILVGNIGSLINLLSFLKWIFYGLNMVSLIILRYHKKFKDIPRPVKIPLVIPIIVLLCAIFIVFVPIINNPLWEFLWAALFVLVGYALYLAFILFKLRLKCMDYVTTFIQLYLQVAKPTRAKD